MLASSIKINYYIIIIIINLITKVEWGVWREIKYVTKKFYFIEMKNLNLEVNQISYITC